MTGKKLYRTEGPDAMLCGVCGGLAEYFGIDPTIIRLGMVLAAVCGSAGVWVYLAAALIVPRKSSLPL